MAGKNRFKQAAPTINFDDPAVLTSVPPVQVHEVEQPVFETPEVKEEKKPEVKAPVVEKRAEEPVKPVEVPAEDEEPAKAEKKTAKENLLAGEVEQKASAKSYALYLETDVVDALDKLAKQNKLSRSKALNALLRKVLMK